MPTDPEGFKAGDAASYDGVADRFDYWTERVTAPLALRVTALARLQAGERVLDIGTGSGVVAIAAARQVGEAGETIGIDLSEGMLKIARSKIQEETPVHFRKMDAERLEFENGSFHVAVSLFALLHFPNPERAVKEMFRVLKPGGRVAIGIGSSMPISWSAFRTLWTRLREDGNCLVAPQALDRFITTRVPQAADYETVGHPETRSLESLLRIAGFGDLKWEWQCFTHKIESPADFWDLQITFSSIVRKRLEAAPAQVIDELRTEFCRKCEAVLNNGGMLIYRNAARIVTAIRPPEKST